MWMSVIQQVINGLVLGSVYGLIAIGYSMVYGILGMINFAHGEIYMISAYLAAISIALFQFFQVPSLILMLIFTLFFTLFVTGLYGFVIERIAYRPLRNSSRLAPLISAIGMSIILQNFVSLSQGARTQAVPVLFSGQEKVGSDLFNIQISDLSLAIMGSAILCMIILEIIIHKTPLGRSMRATQQDLTMATICGVDPNKIIPIVFIIGSIVAAIAGILVTLSYGSFDFSIGFMIGMKAFTSAVLGGIGSVRGAMLGGIILGMSETLFAGFISDDYKDVFAFAILILVLIVKPNGLMGTQEVEKV